MNSVDLAKQYLGVKWVHQGRNPHTGLDCAGLIIQIMKDMNVPVSDRHDYPRVAFDGQMQQALDKEPYLHEIPRKDMQIGDILVMRISLQPQHLAVYNGDTLVHASCSVNPPRVLEQRFEEFKNSVKAVYRIVNE